MGHTICPAQEGRTPRRTRHNQKEFSESLTLHPISFSPIILLVFNSAYSFLSKRCSMTWFGSVDHSPHPPMGVQGIQSPKIQSDLFQSLGPKQSLLSCSGRIRVSHLSEREAVLVFFKISENDNFTAFADSKRR